MPSAKATRIPVTITLPKDVRSHLEGLSKFAGVHMNSVVKLAIAEGVLRGKARLQPEPAREAEVQVGKGVAGSPRFVNLGADGKPTQGGHVAVLDSKTGLTWSAAPLAGGKGMNHADAMKACQQCDLLGHADWRAPTVQELLSIVDYDSYDPAVDPAHFKGPFGYTWTSTPCKGSSGAAWLVDLGYGYSLWSNHSYELHARAVRAGQQLDLG